MAKISTSYALQAGWVRYKNNAGSYTAFAIISIVMSMVFAGIAGGIGTVFGFVSPVLGAFITALIVGVVGQMLSMGYAHFARLDEGGHLPTFSDFFSGFTLNTQKLAIVAIIIAAGTQLVQLALVGNIDQLVFDNETNDMEEMMMALEEYQEYILPMMPKIMLFVMVSIVLGFLVLFAPYKSSLEGSEPLESFKWSIANTLQNALPIVATMIVVVIIAIVGTIFTLGLGLLVIIPYMSLVQYELYNQLIPAAHMEEEIDGNEVEELKG